MPVAPSLQPALAKVRAHRLTLTLATVVTGLAVARALGPPPTLCTGPGDAERFPCSIWLQAPGGETVENHALLCAIDALVALLLWGAYVRAPLAPILTRQPAGRASPWPSILWLLSGLTLVLADLLLSMPRPDLLASYGFTPAVWVLGLSSLIACCIDPAAAAPHAAFVHSRSLYVTTLLIPSFLSIPQVGMSLVAVSTLGFLWPGDSSEVGAWLIFGCAISRPPLALSAAILPYAKSVRRALDAHLPHARLWLLLPYSGLWAYAACTPQLLLRPSWSSSSVTWSTALAYAQGWAALSTGTILYALFLSRRKRTPAGCPRNMSGS